MTYNKTMSICFGGTALAVVLRFLQLFLFTDGKTGFSLQNTVASVGSTVVAALFFTICIVVLLFTTLSNKLQPISAPTVSKHFSLVITGFLMAGYFLVASAVTAVNIADSSMVIYLKLLLQLLCTVFFVFYAVSGLSDLRVPPALALAPVFYSGYELIYSYMECRGVANIPDNLYKLGFLSLILLFFLFEGKLMANTECRKSARLMLPIAGLSFLFGMTCVLPSFIMCLIGKRSALHTAEVPVEYLIFAIYAACFCGAMYREAAQAKAAVNAKVDEVENYAYTAGENE